MLVAELVYVARTEPLEKGVASYGEGFDGRLYSWACPDCQAVSNCTYAFRSAADYAAAEHIGVCAGSPMIPHRHISDSPTADPTTAPACYAIHEPPTPAGDPIDPADLVVVELYDTEQPTTVGTLLEDWTGQLDDSTWEWLERQGYGVDHPRLWVNVVPANEWTPNNHPISYRFALAQRAEVGR